MIPSPGKQARYESYASPIPASDPFLPAARNGEGGSPGRKGES